MRKKPIPIPFGLLFEERAPQPPESLNLVYDDERDVSLVDSDGTLTPLASIAGPEMATHTFTAVEAESTDRDLHSTDSAWYLSTMTQTKAEGEDTDRDRAADILPAT